MPLKSDDYQPRLSIEISQDQFNSLQRLIPYGVKGHLFRVIVEDLINILETSDKREAVLAAIINRMISVTEISTGVVKEESP